MIPKPMVQAFAALLFIFITALILGGCKLAARANDSGTQDIENVIRSGQLRYATDPNTGHCFAIVWLGTDPLLTWVPCS